MSLKKVREAHTDGQRGERIKKKEKVTDRRTEKKEGDR